MRVIPGQLENPKVIALLQAHLAGMNEIFPPEHDHTLDISGLKKPDLSFLTVWDGENLMGCVALKHLSETAGEIKSMRTAAAHLRKGVAAKMLEHIVKEAENRGYRTISLETGSGPAFEPAWKLYYKYGFRPGAAFGSYKANGYNKFLHLNLSEAG